VPIMIKSEDKWRYGLLIGVCVLVMVGCMFYMLNRKAEGEMGL
jgi:hypothetical protein